jgi:hypothetical protein
MIEVIGNEISVQMKANSGIAQPELAAQAARSKQEQEERAKKKASQGSVVGPVNTTNEPSPPNTKGIIEVLVPAEPSTSSQPKPHERQ